MTFSLKFNVSVHRKLGVNTLNAVLYSVMITLNNTKVVKEVKANRESNKKASTKM